MPGLVSAWMGDRLRVDKLCRYLTSHPSQLSLAIPLWVGAMSTSLGWEGNRRSGVALAMRSGVFKGGGGGGATAPPPGPTVNFFG